MHSQSGPWNLSNDNGHRTKAMHKITTQRHYTRGPHKGTAQENHYTRGLHKRTAQEDCPRRSYKGIAEGYRRRASQKGTAEGRRRRAPQKGVTEGHRRRASQKGTAGRNRITRQDLVRSQSQGGKGPTPPIHVHEPNSEDKRRYMSVCASTG